MEDFGRFDRVVPRRRSSDSERDKNINNIFTEFKFRDEELITKKGLRGKSSHIGVLTLLADSRLKNRIKECICNRCEFNFDSFFTLS